MPNFMSYENAQSVLGEFAEAIKSGGGGGGDITSLLTVTFDEEFVGASYTVQAVGGDNETYTGTVPADKKIALHVKQCNVVYNVSASYNNSSYTNEIAVGQYYGVYEMHLYVYHIYGARWEASPSTVWERTDEAANFIDPVPYASGVTNYGSPFDNIYPWSGMIIEEDSTVGTLVKLPKFYYKLTEYGNGGLWIRISDKPAAGFEICPACRKHYTAVGDPEDYERDAVYIGRYLCDPTTYRSYSQCLAGANKYTTSDPSIHSLNSDAWILDFDTLFTVFMLYTVEYADWDSGYIFYLDHYNKIYTGKTGITDDMPYHTGTIGTTSFSMQYRYIEMLCGIPTNITGFTTPITSSTSVPVPIYVYDRLSSRLYDMIYMTTGSEWTKNVGVAYENSKNPGGNRLPTTFRIVKGFFTFFLPTNSIANTGSGSSHARQYSATNMGFKNETFTSSGSSQTYFESSSFPLVGDLYVSGAVTYASILTLVHSQTSGRNRLIFRGIPDNPVPN